MAVKVFNRQGLRRDRNLSDLPSPLSALNNILSTPTMLGNNPSFTVQDLLPITQIYITNINSSTFASLDGVTVSFTVVENGVVNNATNPRTYLPLIKVKNRLDTAYFSTGEPFFFGGDGPDAAYYDSDKIVRDPEQLTLNKVYLGNQIIVSNGKLYRTRFEAQTSVALTHDNGEVNGFAYVADYNPQAVFLNGEFDQLTGQETTVNDNFWEQGQFIYGNKVQDTFVSLFGGANWKGFFKPTVSGISRFYVRTTGSTVFKFQDPGSPSYVGVRYGKVNTTTLNTLGASLQPGTENYILWQSIIDKNNDPTISVIEVMLESPVVLSHNDIVYLEIIEGPALPKQYNILTYNQEPASIDRFWVEVTEDFNLQNVQLSTLPTPGLNPISGYRGYSRYFPYETRQLKTYINSIYHKLFINQFNISGTNTITIADDFEYQHIMINDYIYDYRRRTTDGGNGLRRYIVTGLNDNTRTVTVELDSNYSIDEGSYNDQVAYNSNGSLSFDSGIEITQAYDTGSISGAIAAATLTTELYFVGRYGESTLRTKFIAISQFLEAYVDYAFDWLYYTKDDDIDPTTSNKAWILWYRSEVSGDYFPVDYKYLYNRDYKFYEIGDFKIFLDNSVPGGGTSRETGIDQRAFGAEQLVSKGDQYNELYTLLPIRSTYTPKENWNQVALSRTASLSNGSRLIGLSNITDVQVGNYIIEDSNSGFEVGNLIPSRTRINSVSLNSSSVIVSKPSTSSGSVGSFVFDHRGFVTSGRIQGVSANQYYFYGDGSEIQSGMCVVSKSDSNISTYVRVTKIEYDIANQRYNLNLDKDFSGIGGSVEGPFSSSSQTTSPTTLYGWHTRSGGIETNAYTGVRQLIIRWNGSTIYDSASSSIPIPSSGGITIGAYTYYPDQYYPSSLYGWTNDYNNAFGVYRIQTGGSSVCAVYYDRGVDITKPLEAFCTDTGCAQNDYDPSSDIVKTRYIAIEIGAGNIPGNDVRWTEASATGTYGGGNNPDRVVLSNGSAAVSWWSEAFPNQNFENHGEAQFNGGKRYASNCIFVKLTGTNLASSLQQDGHTNLTSDYVPIGFIEGMIRVDGDIWNGNTLTATDQKKYYFVIRLAERWQSYTDFDVFTDGGQRGKIVDFTRYPSSDFNIEYFGFAPNGSIMLSMASSNVNVSTGAILDSARTNYVNNVNSSTYYDRIHRITADITLTSTQRAYFQNPDSFSRFNEVTQTTEYVLPTGSYFKTLSTTGLLVWFNSFEDLQHTHSLYAYPFDIANQTPNQNPISRTTHNAINIYPQDGPVKITSNNWQTDQFRYLHYRRQQYEVLPMPIFAENRFTGLRVLNQNEQTANVTSFLQNSVNRLSVFTFANTTDNRELCCPPLDTSPPFDSSAIGLATTVNEPNMSIGGLVNVRGIAANHPEEKIHNIPSGFSNNTLSVDKKLEIVFGGLKYDLLIADTKPF